MFAETESRTEARQGAAPQGRIDELSAVLRDCMIVTERLQHTHDKLQGEVVRLRRELESKDRELERRRRLAALGELAAGMAHEVRNPLGAIQLYSGLLRKQCGDPGSAMALIEKIEAGIRAIEGVVQDTLALAPRGARIMPRVLNEILRRAADACARILDLRGVRLRIEPADDDVLVMADDGALQRVLVNLIANAADASPVDGEIVVAAEVCERFVEHMAEETGQRPVTQRDGQVAQRFVVVRVLDRGPGLPEGLADRIFDPFFTTKDHGTGLGLTIASRLVELHGGRLRAAGREGGGAEFVVEIPAADGEAASSSGGDRQSDAA